MDLNPIHGSRSKLLVGVANFKKMFSIQLAAAAKKVAPKPKAKAAAPKAAKKDAVKPKKLVAAAKPKKVAAAWLAVAWSIVVGLIFLSRAGDGTAATADGRAEPELWSPYPEAEAGARSCRESSSSTPWRCLSSVRPGDVVPHPCLDGAEAAPQPILPASVTCQHRPPSSIHSRRRSAGDELATTAGFPVLPSSFASKASRWGPVASRWVPALASWALHLPRAPHAKMADFPSFPMKTRALLLLQLLHVIISDFYGGWVKRPSTWPMEIHSFCVATDAMQCSLSRCHLSN